MEIYKCQEEKTLWINPQIGYPKISLWTSQTYLWKKKLNRSGGRGIRTPDILSDIYAFQAYALGHYAIPPFLN
jgi:hypothetical protein